MTGRPSRILYVCEYATASGGERSLLAWLPFVAKAGYDVSVLAPGEGVFAELIQRLDILLIPWETIHCDDESRLAARRNRLGEVLREWQPDFVHANSLSMSRVVGPVAQKLDVASIAHLRDILRLSRRAIKDINCNTIILTVSHATAQWHISQGISAEKTNVLHNGVDTSEFAPRSQTGYLHRELRLRDDALLLGSIGQIGMRKGLDVLLEAMPIILAAHPNAHLLLVGQRTSNKEEAMRFEEALRADASQTELAGHVHFLGYREDTAALLNELTLLVHAARQEPLGRVLLEAAASGTAILATDVGGTREILDDSCGVIVPPDDAAAIASNVTRLLDDPNLMVKQAEAARNRMKKRFDITQSAAALLQHYRALL